MHSTLSQQLEAYVTRNNFPAAEWEERGLNPSDEDVQTAMQQAVVDFVQHLQAILPVTSPGTPTMTAAVQNFLEEWDIDNFDTEEREFLYDVAADIMRVVEVQPEDIDL